jgi:hypothetical protein
MVKVHVEADCGNAPKKLFLRDFVIALAKQDEAAVLESLMDNVQWHVVGKSALDGKAEVEKRLKSLMEDDLSEVTIINVLSHGNEGAVNGTLTLTDDETYGFCHFCVFSSHGKNARIKEITSYRVKEHKG